MRARRHFALGIALAAALVLPTLASSLYAPGKENSLVEFAQARSRVEVQVLSSVHALSVCLENWIARLEAKL
jgi:hypothetical protein